MTAIRFFSAEDGARLGFFDSGGEGAPIVLLHPTPVNHGFWLPVLELLPGVRAIVPDLRGHGVSELGDMNVLSMERLAGDVLAMLDAVGVREAAFVGCSIGGYVLLELWRQAPERVRGLAFLCSKPQADSDAGRAKRSVTIARVKDVGPEEFLDTAATSLLGESSLKRNPILASRARSMMRLSTAEVVAVQSGLAARPDSVPTVRTITVPVLAVAGSEDAACTPDEVRAFLSAPGGCEFHLLGDAGHYAAFEQPEGMAKLLGEWLRAKNLR